jgi:magnesium chelatase accessory protein
MGQGPIALLVHGTGGATHSWRGVMPLLARRFTVVAPDLPGHGFTGIPPARGLSLGGMGELLSTLLAALGPALGAPPAVAVGHSAGAAVLLRMALDGRLAPATPGAFAPAFIVGVNAALEPPPALYSSLLAPAIGAFASSSFVAALAARAASAPGVVRSLLRSTGSALDDDQVALYEALCRSAPRTGAVLTMMANWELGPLRDDLARVTTPVTLIAAADDGWVPPRVARDAALRLPRATVLATAGGHLVHEVRPSAIADAILAAAG